MQGQWLRSRRNRLRQVCFLLCCSWTWVSLTLCSGRSNSGRWVVFACVLLAQCSLICSCVLLRRLCTGSIAICILSQNQFYTYGTVIIIWYGTVHETRYRRSMWLALVYSSEKLKLLFWVTCIGFSSVCKAFTDVIASYPVASVGRATHFLLLSRVITWRVTSN